MGDFFPGKHPETGIDISDSGRSSAIIYFGDEFNEAVVSFKAFLDSLSYEISKETEAQADEETGAGSFVAKNGSMSIKVGFSVPASSISESKKNLAKISFLQTSIRQHQGVGENDNGKNRMMVYLSNLINNGNEKKFLVVEDDTVYASLRSVAFACAIETVVYEPDFSVGFHEDSSGIYPKYFSVSLTLNPDMQKNLYYEQNMRTFLKPFNSNGHYNRSDSCFFPFLIKTGQYADESLDFKTYCTNKNFKEQYEVNKKEVNSRHKSSKIMISLPIDPSNFKRLEDSDSNKNSYNSLTEVPRYCVFEAFIKKFSRDFTSKANMKKDPNGLFDQIISGVSTNQNVKYSLSFDVPSASLSDAKRNCAKLQYLMRMVYKRYPVPQSGVSLEEASKNEAELNSVKIYVHSILEKSNDSTSIAKDISEMYDRAAYLQVNNLTVEIDLKAGFFTQGSKMYPKEFSINIDLIDSYWQNYVKQKQDGTYEDRKVSIGQGEQQLVDLHSGTVQDNNVTWYDGKKESNFLSKIKYWKPGS